MKVTSHHPKKRVDVDTGSFVILFAGSKPIAVYRRAVGDVIVAEGANEDYVESFVADMSEERPPDSIRSYVGTFNVRDSVAVTVG